MTYEKQVELFKLDFLGIGAYKCATTWIYECLREHPEIFIISAKTEPQATYFLEQTFQKKLNYYNSLFKSARPNQLKGEFTERYLECGNEVIGRMIKHNPEMKLIVCLRNPIERALSQYLNRIHITKMKFSSFEEAIEKDFRVIVERGFYYQKLLKFYNTFPKKNILIMIKEDINADAIEFIKRIYKFLYVDPSFVPRMIDRKISPTNFKVTKLGKTIYKITPWLKRNKLGYRIQQSRLLKTWFYSFADFYSNKKNSIPQMRKETHEYLKVEYREDIQKLEKLINQDLNHWK